MTSRAGRITLVLAIAVLLCGAERPRAQTPGTPPSRLAAGLVLVDAIAARQFEKVTAQFNATMKSALPEDSLQKAWDGAVLQLGPFKSRGMTREQQRGVYTAVIVSC